MSVGGGDARGNGGPGHVLGTSRPFGMAAAQGARWGIPDNDIVKRLGYNAKA